MDFPNLFSQPGGGQSSNSLVQQQPEWKLPPTITPTVATGIPDPLGGMSDKLEGKSQALGMMLYALGGALRGDKDFVLKTLKLQDLQEGKKKQEEKKKAYQDLLKSMEGNYDQRMIDFAKVLGHEKGSELLMSTFTKEPKERKMVQDAEGYYRYVDTGERVFPGIVKPEKEKTLSGYVADIAKKVQDDPNYQLSDQDKRVLAINRKASESAMMLEELQAQALKDYNIGGNESLPVFSTKEQAQAAGLKPGDRFKDPSGNIYTVK